MASGLVCRANRPNTLLHRPACKREEKPCQLGAVHTWHFAAQSQCGRMSAAGKSGLCIVIATRAGAVTCAVSLPSTSRASDRKDSTPQYGGRLLRGKSAGSVQNL